MKHRNYRCRFLGTDGRWKDCVHMEKHQGRHTVLTEEHPVNGVVEGPGRDMLWNLFGLSYAAFLVLSERDLDDMPAKASARLRELWDEMPIYLLYDRPEWRAQARKEGGHFAGAHWGRDHLVWCRSAMHSMYDDWQREVAEILGALMAFTADGPPKGWSISFRKNGRWVPAKKLALEYLDYRHRGFERRLVRDLEGFQARARRWAAETFPTQDEASIIAHLRDEVNNELHVGCDPLELADVGLILISLAGLRGISLGAVMDYKHEVCRRRQWVQDGGDGFPAHIEESSDMTNDQPDCPACEAPNMVFDVKKGEWKCGECGETVLDHGDHPGRPD